MRQDHVLAVRTSLTALTEFLDQIAAGQSPDRELAARAAHNIRGTIHLLDEASDAKALRAAFKVALYDISSRGMFDWPWSPEAETLLEEQAERVFRALDRADRYVRRHARST